MAFFVGPNSIIQSDFVSNGPHGNLEAVLLVDGQIHHWYGVPGLSAMAWSPGQILPTSATGPASIIQSSFRSGNHGNFEVVLLAADGLWHWWHDNSDVASHWQRGGLVSPHATAAGSIIQSSLGSPGNFEVVVLEPDGLWHHWHDNSNVNSPWQRGGLVSAAATGPGCIIQSNLGSPGNFEVVVLEGNELWHHWHDNSNVNSPWQRGQRISAHANGPGSIIQSNFGTPGNFEVVVLEGNNLVHYWHDNSNVNSPWQTGQIVSVAATGPGSIVRSDYGPGGPGNFEVLVQELTQSVVHYWHHNVDPNLPWLSGPTSLPWWRGPRVLTETPLDSPDMSVKIAQLTGEYDRQLKKPTLSRTESRYGVVGTDLGSSFEHAGRTYFLFGDTTVDGVIRKDPQSNLDTIAYTMTPTPDNGIVLVCNPSYPKVDNILQTTFCVPCDGVSVPVPPVGAAWMIQSNFGGTSHHTFEVVVLEGNNLVHWRHDNSNVANPWRRAQTITASATGPGCLIQSGFGHPGNFEVVVLEGNQLRHYWHDNSNMDSPWRPGAVITSDATGPGCIIQSSMGSPGNFEVVVLEGGQLWHHWLDNSNPSKGWQRGGLVTSRATGPGCIIQSAMGNPGNFEVVVPEGNGLWHHWHDNSNVTSAWQRGGLVTSDATGPACIIQSTFGSPGNFEVVVLQGGSIWHHWHDNSNVASPWQPGGRVAMNATGPACIIQGNYGSPGNFEVVAPIGPVLQHFYHDNSNTTLPWTPAEVITSPSMYVFFTTDPIMDPGTWNVSMGRCVLARSDDGGKTFGSSLFDLSRGKFINLSLQLVECRDHPGLPMRFGQGLLIWGSGRYRASNVYLGFVPLASIEDRSTYLFYNGLAPNDSLPVWVADESQAVPLFLDGSIGEFCVRWNPFLREFVMAYNCDNLPWIRTRQSATPWGTWTEAESIFDYGAAIGPGGFLHNPALNDGLSDPNTNDPGLVYAPYFIEPYTRGNPDQSTTMFYVLSTHNPYNTMLMSVRIRSRILLPRNPFPLPSVFNHPRDPGIMTLPSCGLDRL
jgi:hypothetical protein